MIPDEAVDAAVKIIYGDAQEGVTAEFKSFIRAKVRAALEAAAPYMLAEFEKQRKYEALDAISELGSDEPGEPLTKRSPNAR